MMIRGHFQLYNVRSKGSNGSESVGISQLQKLQEDVPQWGQQLVVWPLLMPECKLQVLHLQQWDLQLCTPATSLGTGWLAWASKQFLKHKDMGRPVRILMVLNYPGTMDPSLVGVPGWWSLCLTDQCSSQRSQPEQRSDSEPKIPNGTGNSCDLHSRTMCSSQRYPAEHREKGPSHWSIFPEGSWWQMWHNPEILCSPPMKQLKIHNAFQSTYRVSCQPDELESVGGALSRPHGSSPTSTTLDCVTAPSSASLCVTVTHGLMPDQDPAGLWHM